MSKTEGQPGAGDAALGPEAVAEPAPESPMKPPGGVRVVYVEVVDLSPLADEAVQRP